MKPIMMHGHERSITQIKYNSQGDLLFSSAKDHHPNVWFSLNGERLGTYDGHCGAVWCLDPKWDTSQLVTGAADNSVRLWDIGTGRQLAMVDTKSAVRTCNYSYSGNMICFTTDKQMGHPCEINVLDAKNFSADAEPVLKLPIPPNGPKVTAMLWAGLEDTLLTGHDNGDIVQWDLKTSKKLQLVSDHQKSISDMQPSKDGTMFISSSKDTTARLWDSDSLEMLKVYKTERPVNSASMSPTRDHVVLGGGQDAMDVTTTSTKVGKFDARFFHMVFEEEFGRVKGHFGPINSVMFHPDGKGYASGGEDGYIRVHQFDESYSEFEFDY
jgi:translation initiation factor 3 subunit I